MNLKIFPNILLDFFLDMLSYLEIFPDSLDLSYFSGQFPNPIHSKKNISCLLGNRYIFLNVPK
jgi:hypothetical protein